MLGELSTSEVEETRLTRATHIVIRLQTPCIYVTGTNSENWATWLALGWRGVSRQFGNS